MQRHLVGSLLTLVAVAALGSCGDSSGKNTDAGADATAAGSGGSGGTSGTGGTSGSGGVGGTSGSGGTGSAGAGGTSGTGGSGGVGGDAGGSDGATDGGDVDAGRISECAGANVCTAAYPCQNLAPDYTCRGQYADWTPSDSPAAFAINGDGTVTDARSALVWQDPVESQRRTWADAKSYCADLSLAGGAWRLPTKAELESIVDFGEVDPAISAVGFPGTLSGHFWSSSAYVGSPDRAWFVNSIAGVSYYDDTSVPKRVRCVRGNATVTVSTGSGGAPPTRYTLNGETVEDNRTGLTWQREVAPGVYEQAAAITYCTNLELGGFSDWRLPALSELLTLVDPTSVAPAIDVAAFPSAPSEWAWSSTANLGGFGGGWGVKFDAGNSIQGTGSYRANARCVR